jgi:alcohol dehydrogenase (cytochrome c)
VTSICPLAPVRPIVRCGILVLGIAVQNVAPRVDAQSLTSPSYTAAQAAEGRSAYVLQCVSCHGTHLDDGEFAPPLKGAEFRQRWGAQSADGLFSYMRTKMPPARPALGDETYVQLLAYILQENGQEPGPRELSAEPDLLKSMGLMLAATRPGVSGGLVAGVVMPPPPVRPNPLDKIRPVTDAMLNDPPDGEWLTWRRTPDGLGFSPLKQINKRNVTELRVAWGWSLPAPIRIPPCFTTAFCSFTATATRFRRSMQSPETCCGSIPVGCPRA